MEVIMSKPSPMGGTFAERAAANDGKSSFTAPDPGLGEEQENSSFADRGKAAPKAKAVKADDAEDKSVTAKKATTKKA